MPALDNKHYLLTALTAYAAFDLVLYMTYMNRFPAETKTMTGALQGQDYLWPGVAAAGVGGLLAYNYLHTKSPARDYLMVALGAYAAFDIALYATYFNRAPEQTKAVLGKLQAQDYLWPAVAAVGVGALVAYYAAPTKGGFFKWFTGKVKKEVKKVTK